MNKLVAKITGIQEAATTIEGFIAIMPDGRIFSGNNSYTLGKNDLQIIPMGTDHHMNLMLGENIRFVTVFGLPEKSAASQSGKLK